MILKSQRKWGGWGVGGGGYIMGKAAKIRKLNVSRNWKNYPCNYSDRVMVMSA